MKNTEGTELVQCWSHTRREFLKAEKRDPERVKWILRQIQLMYKVEEKVRGKPPNKILKAREVETKPLVETEGYDLMITTDQNLQYQQHLSSRSIGIVVLLSTTWPRIKLKTSDVASVVNTIAPDGYQEVAI